MEFQIPLAISKKLKIIAYYQIAGGCLGFLIMAWATVERGSLSEKQIILSAVAVSLWGFSIFCGKNILKGDLVQAIRLSLINQFLQVLSFSVFGFVFTYGAGLFVAIGFDFTDNFKFALHFGPSTFSLSLNTDSNLILLEVNLIAVYILWLLNRLKKELETEATLFNSLSRHNCQDILPSEDEISIESGKKR